MKTPEQMAEEYCEDHDECEFARDAFLAGYKAAQDQLADASKVMPQWISVKERLPEHDQSVLYRLLIKTKNGQAYKLDYGEYNLQHQIFYGEYLDYRDEGWDVTHWMPLPEAPKE